MDLSPRYGHVIVVSRYFVLTNNDARLILRKNDMIEAKLKANNCNRGQLFRSCWVSSARCSKLYKVFSWSTDIHILTKMVMTSDETQIQILANWPMSHAKRVTRDNWKNPEHHVVSAIRSLRTDTNCPVGKS